MITKGTEAKNAKEIPLHALVENDPQAWAEFSWQLHPNKVKKAFDAVDIDVKDKEDLYSLMHLAKNNGDKRGDLKTPSGKSVKFDFVQVLKNIEWSDRAFKETFGITPDKTLINRSE